MDFDTLLAVITELLQRQGRVSYGALKRRFNLDDAYMQDLREELISAQRLAIDEEGKILVWVGAAPGASSDFQVPSSSRHSLVGSSPLATPRLQTPNAEPLAAERRQLTVLFCDLVGSTALSTQLDPEDLRTVIRQYQHLCADVIQRYDGYIAQYLGDGILVYFGYPYAHEDDARRAVRAGLEMVAALQTHDFSPVSTHDFQVRIGIHTGVVVIGDMGAGGRKGYLALGEAPTIAARIQGLAEPNAVLLSAATQRLVEKSFECQPFGSHLVAGVDAPIAVYHVQSERLSVGPLAGRATVPLIGREQELGLLLDRWEQVKEGHGHIVLLSGEPGIGKSRLAYALQTQVANDNSLLFEARCSPYHQQSALYPLIDVLQRTLLWTRHGTDSDKVAKLARVLALYDMRETLPLFTDLLSLPTPASSLPPPLTPQQQKEQTLHALLQLFLAQTARQATVSVWEDLHWADPSSLEFLLLLTEQIPTTKLLLVLTFRPEFIPPWKPRSHISHLMLNRLGKKQVEDMVQHVAAGKELSSELVDQIRMRADGVPLFVEELTKSVMETIGTNARSSLSPFAIPATLQETLLARLDRLSTARRVAQLGATLGREFSQDLIQAVAPVSEGDLSAALEKLVEAEILYQRGVGENIHYVFKHALIQDTAYQSLLKSTRQQYHQQIARVLEERFPDTRDTQPELLAHHYTEAQLLARALPYWQQAGELALKRLALREALAHLNQGMEILGALPPSPERDGKELDLRILLGTTWMALRGWAASEVWTSLHPALGLAKALNRREALLPIYDGLWSNILTQGRIAESLTWIHEMLATAEARGDQDLLIVAHSNTCAAYFWRGEGAQSRLHGDRVTALYDEEQHRHFADLTNTDPKTNVGLYDALGTWMRGYPDQAVRRLQANDSHARHRNHPFDLGFACVLGSLVYDYRCEPAAMLARVSEAERLGRAHSLPVISEVLAQVTKGIAWIRGGRLAEGIPHLQEALEIYQASGAALSMPYNRAVLAEGLAVSGDATGGLRLIEESLVQIAQPGGEERCHLAEILRLKGWMLSLQGDLNEAEQSYFASLAVARQQQAKSWELRTATSLAHLWRQQGKRAEAHNLLSEVYHWFTEGFGTKDLQEARALLQELSHRVSG